MKFFTGLSLVASALAVRMDVTKRDSPLKVEIQSVGNSAVKAVVTNTGSEPIRLMKTGSILDQTAVEKAEIFSGADQVGFDGVRLQVQTSDVAEDAFQTLAAGESLEAEFDPAEVHDLSNGGDFDFLVRGTFLTASAGSTSIDGSVPFDSNVLKSHVDGVAAAKVRRDFHDNMKRTVIQSDCTGTRGTAQRTALTNCAALARKAATAATSGAAAKLTEYFKSSTTATRNTVADVFNKAATECGSTTSGVSTQYCTDTLGYCSSNVLAYTIPSRSIMVSCPLYFSALTALSTQCHAQDQATTTLHESTHLTQIKGTADNGYGYSAVQGLTSAQSLNNADSYALFANAIQVGC
ncbi:Deuterolysin metalloprotease family-domain-containing protein [Diaporthe sp. PMI_573]|nr:Deuterolysin metalloprotease family-domain-containing protein [Diaporthaceae sp. PMI_573]